MRASKQPPRQPNNTSSATINAGITFNTTPLHRAGTGATGSATRNNCAPRCRLCPPLGVHSCKERGGLHRPVHRERPESLRGLQRHARNRRGRRRLDGCDGGHSARPRSGGDRVSGRRPRRGLRRRRGSLSGDALLLLHADAIISKMPSRRCRGAGPPAATRRASTGGARTGAPSRRGAPSTRPGPRSATRRIILRREVLGRSSAAARAGRSSMMSKCCGGSGSAVCGW